MDDKTIIKITNGNKVVTFAYNSPFWVSELRGASGVPVRLSTVQSLGQVGSSVSNISIGEREMVLEGSFFDPIADNRKALIALFAPGASIEVEVTENNESWTLDAIVSDEFSASDGVGVQEFQAPFTAVLPYWQSVDRVDTLITGLTPLFMFPFYTGGTWKISEFKEDFFSTITNEGNVPYGCEFLFKFQSQVIEPEILKVETNQVIRFIGEYNAGDSIFVKTSGDETGQAEITVIRSDGTYENGYTLADFESSFSMRIMPGQNTFRAGAAQGRTNMTVQNTAPEAVTSGI